MKKQALLLAAIVIPAITFAGTYFVRPDSYFTGIDDTSEYDGSSWDKALPYATFRAGNTANSYDSGSTFYFSGGTYYASDSTKIFIKGINIIGGYDPASTGTTAEQLTYPTDYPTIFSGDVDGDNTHSSGDLWCIFYIQQNTTHGVTTNECTIEGCDFTMAYGVSYKDSGRHGAVVLNNCGSMIFKNCNFYDNYATDKTTSSVVYGGIALTNHRSNVILQDCEFYNNTAYARGAAIRMTSDDAAKGQTILERCSIYNNTVEDGLGSAIIVQQAGYGLYLVNTNVYNNTATGGSTVAAIYVNASGSYTNKCCLISSSVTDNSGYQVYVGASSNEPCFQMFNSVISGGTTSTDAALRFYGTPTSTTDGYVKSLGYNSVGSYYLGGYSGTRFTDTDDKAATRILSQGANLEQIAEAAADLMPSTVTNAELCDFTLDMYGYYRGDYSSNGAKADISGYLDTVDPYPTFTVPSYGYTTYYSQYGYTLPDGVDAAVITSASGTSVDGSYDYSGGYWVPANSALLIKGSQGEATYSITDMQPAELTTKDNLLRGTMVDTTTTASDLTNPVYYKLTGDDAGNVCFSYGADNGAAFTNEANAAYLAVDATDGTDLSSSLSVTGITSASPVIATDTQQSKWTGIYNLSGVKLQSADRNGIYIIDGKKVIVNK